MHPRKECPYLFKDVENGTAEGGSGLACFKGPSQNFPGDIMEYDKPRSGKPVPHRTLEPSISWTQAFSADSTYRVFKKQTWQIKMYL